MASSFVQRLFRRVSDDRQPEDGFGRAVQSTLAVAAPVVGLGAWANRLLHESGVLRRHSLPAVVLSVGNITLGGTGKTPFTLWLTRWLGEDGRRPAILTRGYGREDEDRLVVVHDGKSLRATPREAGDEPVLLARNLKSVPVYACANRWKAGRLVLRRHEVDTLVLDDGFQHVALDRHGDIVLLDATKPLGRLRLFPRGSLREPLGALARAHLIVLTRCDQAKNLERFVRQVRRYAPNVPVVRTRMAIRGVLHLATRERHAAVSLKGQSAILACAVGNPDSVRRSVRALGMKVPRTIALDDHAQPTRRDVATWEAQRRKARAKWILVTEKDAVKLTSAGNLPESLGVLEAALEFLSEDDERLAKRVLRARIESRAVRGLLR